MKRVHAVLLLPVAVFVLLMVRPARQAENIVLADAPARHAFRVVFGVGDKDQQKWDGRLEVRGGKLVRLEGWRVWQNDRIDGDRFQLTTRPGTIEDQLHPPKEMPGRAERLIPAGLIVTLEGDGAQVAVESAGGNFAFRENEVTYGQPAAFLNGRVQVERIPPSELLSSAETLDDYPSITTTRKGETWVAWIGYKDAADRVFVRRQTGGAWSQPESWQEPAGAPADYFRTAMAEDGAGRVWVVWAAQVNGSWDLYGRALDGTKWSAAERLTAGAGRGAGPNLFHKLARASDGRLYLVWQGFRNGVSSILLKRQEGAKWSAEMLLSEASGSSWEPSIAADSKGRVWVAWDGYGAGNYDIYARQVAASKPGTLLRVTRSPNFEAHADIACDPQDRPWIAFDESSPNWGKDWSHDAMRGNLLYLSRKPRVTYYDQGEWREPQADPMEAVAADIRRYNELPQIAFDGGKLWMVFRSRTETNNTRPDTFAGGGRWHFYATCLLGDRWMPAVFLPDSVGRNYQRAALAAAGGGRGGLLVAWPTDNRPFRGPAARRAGDASRGLEVYFSLLQAPAQAVVAGSIPSRRLAEAAYVAPLAAQTSLGQAGATPVHPAESAQVTAIRSYRITSGGKTYRILRGDMHRHTELSPDGAGDGSLFDLYRYSIDAARLDYVLVADHQMGGGDEYNWWITQKSNDMFYVQGAFLPLYGYERSVPYPNGHRNLVFPKRGVRALVISPEEAKAVKNSGPILYPHLKENGAIGMEHSLATSQGTDWRDNDPELEPLAELYQGYHSSYEYEGAPRTESDATGHVHGSYEKAGFFWNALARGYKLGVQASSDHISTHLSYACIITDDNSRQGMIDAMKKRHAYAATDNIILDYRMVDGAGEHLQGDIFSASGTPRIVVKIKGTGSIEKVDLVKNNKFILSKSPGTADFDLTYQDAEAQPGEAYYYLRVIQKDGQMAWSSPIWVTHKK
ncbi:MAG: hypothetical protein NTZ98_19045 [Acidobacteria bacterium]|nr:hypothetical protein [Acidobacteriota bacterium]